MSNLALNFLNSLSEETSIHLNCYPETPTHFQSLYELENEVNNLNSQNISELPAVKLIELTHRQQQLTKKLWLEVVNRSRDIEFLNDKLSIEKNINEQHVENFEQFKSDNLKIEQHRMRKRKLDVGEDTPPTIVKKLKLDTTPTTFGSFTKTKLCRFFNKGYCRNFDSCKFAHGESELNKTPPKYKPENFCPW